MKLKTLLVPEAQVSKAISAFAALAIFLVILDSAWNDVYDTQSVAHHMWGNPANLFRAIALFALNIVDSHSLLLAIIGVVALVILNLLQASFLPFFHTISAIYMKSMFPPFDDYEFWPQSGIAIGAQTWSSTHVSGGQVSSHGDVISSTPVSSRTVTHNRFFLRSNDGREQEVELTDSFGVRDGHRITIIYGKLKRKANASGAAMYCYNHATGLEHVWRAAGKASGLAFDYDSLIAFIGCCLIGWIMYSIVGLWCFLVGPVSGVVLYIAVLHPPVKTRHALLLTKLRAAARAA